MQRKYDLNDMRPFHKIEIDADTGYYPDAEFVERLSPTKFVAIVAPFNPENVLTFDLQNVKIFA